MAHNALALPAVPTEPKDDGKVDIAAPGQKADDAPLPLQAGPADLDLEERYPTGPKGRLETIAERELREAHNLRMKFNRSFDSA